MTLVHCGFSFTGNVDLKILQINWIALGSPAFAIVLDPFADFGADGVEPCLAERILRIASYDFEPNLALGPLTPDADKMRGTAISRYDAVRFTRAHPSNVGW